MIIRQNKLFHTLRLVLYGISILWLFLLFLVVIDVNNDSASDFDSKTHAAKIKNCEQLMGPFKLNNKEYIELICLLKTHSLWLTEGL
jgi:hypothetical protein